MLKYDFNKMCSLSCTSVFSVSSHSFSFCDEKLKIWTARKKKDLQKTHKKNFFTQEKSTRKKICTHEITMKARQHKTHDDTPPT